MSLKKYLKKELYIGDFLNSMAFVLIGITYILLYISNPSLFFKTITQFDGLLSFNVFTGMIFLLTVLLLNDRILNTTIRYYKKCKNKY